jgi:hypothetical protein
MNPVRREVPKGHPIIAADLRNQLMQCAREAVRRDPVGHGVCLEELMALGEIGSILID